MRGFERIQIAVFFAGLLVAVIAEDPPQVCIDDGCLIGITELSRSNRTFYSFLGVPYAKPPLGELRFKNAQAPDPWDTLNATKNGNICPQSIFFRDVVGAAGDEDCLYLNVYTHQTSNSTDLRPVLVFLHTGGYMFFAANNDFFPGNNLLDRDVVVVAPNYRLNVFGFLSTEDEECPGNWGLKDQTFALRWIQKNIANFGGDPNKVTLLGHSAGGYSSHFHMLSPLSKGLFHRVFAQSGNALGASALSCLTGDARNHAVSLGQYLGCSTDNSSVLVECLRGKTTDELMNADSIFVVWDKNPWVPYKPVIEPEIEGAFLTSLPIDLIKRGEVNDVPLMIGIVDKEGAVMSCEYISNQTLLDDMGANLNTSFPSILMYTNVSSAESSNITDKVIDFYYGDSNFTTDEITPMTDMFGDHFFTWSFLKTVELQKDKQTSPIFAYKFEFLSNITLVNALGYPPREYNGTTHGDELIYLFQLESTFFKGYVHTAEENALVERMLDLWTNFATNGTPTHTGYDIEWTPVTGDFKYMAIRGADDCSMINTTFFPERMAFWESMDLETTVCRSENENLCTDST